MTEIFVFGTLCHAPVLRIVAGDVVVAKAELSNAAVMAARGTGWPVLVAAKGQRLSALVILADAQATARLDAYEACFGYARYPLTVEIDGAARGVSVYRPVADQPQCIPDTDGPWSLADWVRDWGAIEAFAAEEVMRQLQTAPPAEVGRRFGIIASRAQAMVNTQAWRRPALVGANPPRSDVAVVARRFPYTKFFAVEEVTLRHRQFDGRMFAPQERAVFRASDAVTVLPYDPLRDRILVIEQLRLGAYVQQDPHPWLLEPIAGMIDAAEDPQATARREAMEEAGLTLGALHHVARYYPSPGGIAQVLHSFVAMADLPDDITGIAGHLAEGEDILSHIVPWDLACAMLAGGDMANAPLIMSMQWLQLHRARLRASG
ncbi:MAG: NUDIX domain-containing protein [Proteobacteria bacterium]|nr:NUDIX domain-containing protein [Pseudomonadota bacterium]